MASTSVIIPDVITCDTVYNSDTLTITESTALDVVTVDPMIFTWQYTEFVDCFPEFEQVKEMCNQYPALDIALKKFEEIYKMVEDDYAAQQGKKYNP